MLKVNFKEIIEQLKQGRYLIDTMGYKGKPYYGIYDNYNKTPVFPVKGLKDSMVLCEILCYLSTQELALKVKDTLCEVYSTITDYIEVGEICNSLGVIDLEEYPNSLVAFDNNSLQHFVFELRNGKNVETYKMSRNANNINYFKCWNYVYSLKGQTKMSVNVSFELLHSYFNEIEILYICYLLQYSAKIWCKEILKRYRELSIKL